ncbi:MAG TPA: class II fumarate hydratase [Bacteroidota bacterium]
MEKYRIERDSMGEVNVPRDAYWGAQTQRAIDNFRVSGTGFPFAFIRSLALVKRASATVNQRLGLLEPRLGRAISKACDEITGGKLAGQFPLDIYQTGSGTSTNMNANEVIATRANEILTGSRHSKDPIHPNDHVNLGQSSNDVIPTVIHVSAYLQTVGELLPALEHFAKALRQKQKQYTHLVKTGRTHLMDAMPITLSQEISGWAAQVEASIARVKSALPRLSELAIGGTAIGTGINTNSKFGRLVAKELSSLTKVKFAEAPNHFEAQAAQDGVVELSGQLKTYATALLKISNDLRWMNSGPIAGLAELRLPSLQPGSSIMPGKVNPVIPEAARMVAVQVMGNDFVIGVSNALGEFQLNVMLPLIAHKILESIALLANVTRLMADRVIDGFEVNADHMKQLLHRNPILATVLNPIIGYDKSAEVVKKALKENKTVRQVVVEMGYLTAPEADRILDPQKMTKPGFSG